MSPGSISSRVFGSNIEGEIGSAMYIVRDGEVEVKEKNTVIRVLRKGDYFGEKSILLDTKRSKDCVARTNCVVCSISAEVLKNMIGPKYRQSLYSNFMKMAMCDSEVFKKFNLKLLDSAISMFKIKHYNKHQTVMNSGAVMSSVIIIIIQGNLIDVIRIT